MNPSCSLGICSGFHDSSIALIENKNIIFAIQEERLSRSKSDSRLPICSLDYLQNNFPKYLENLEFTCFYENPKSRLTHQIKSNSITKTEDLVSIGNDWITSSKLSPLEDLSLRYEFINKSDQVYCSHHESHAFYSHYMSGFDKSICLVIDAMGEWETLSIYSFSNNEKFNLIRQQGLPFSLGLLYTYFTAALGFKPNEGEYKLMGLAPYGEPIFLDNILEEINYNKKENRIILPDYMFKYNCIKFDRLLTILNNLPSNLRFPIDLEKGINDDFKSLADIAASVQKTLETIVIDIISSLSDLIKEHDNNLVLGGGVALNCSLVYKISDYIDGNLYVPPSPGDSGSAVGAVLSNLSKTKRPQSKSNFRHINNYENTLFTGTIIREDDIFFYAKKANLSVVKDNSLERTIEALTNKQIGAIVYGRSEFGPRALGRRSIICRHDLVEMKNIINFRIKRREHFRPFAAVFNVDQSIANFYLKKNKYGNLEDNYFQMTSVAISKGYFNQQNSSAIHVDNTCRLQVLPKGTNNLLEEILIKLEDDRNIVGLLNTSFNINGQPNVELARDVFYTFDSAGLDFIIYSENGSDFYYLS